MASSEHIQKDKGLPAEHGQPVYGSEMTYEEALAELERTVSRLESGETTLDEAMQLFQQGTALAKICAERLAAIEKKITQLVTRPDGSDDEMPFGEDV